MRAIVAFLLVGALLVSSFASCAAQMYCYREHPVIAVLGGCGGGSTVSRYDHSRRGARTYHPARSHSRR